MVESKGLRSRAPLVVAIASVLLLAACGGSSSGGGSGTTNNGGGSTGGSGTGGGDTGGTGAGGGSGTPPVTVSGKAADGYLSGATVCLDVDADMRCGATEPTATTGSGGAFTLTVPEGVDAAAHSMVVQVSASTVDEDTGLAVGKPYVLSAPAGESDFISPLTTVVHGMLQLNPALSLEDAVTQVKLSIGASADVSLFEDYVAAKQDSANAAADDYERLHRIAQVSAKAMAENHEAVMNAAAAEGIDPAESQAALVALVTGEVLKQLESVAIAVDEAGDEFDVDAVTVQTADVTNLAEQLAEAEAAASATKVSIQSLLATGVYWMWAEDNEFEYGFLEAGSEAGRIQETWHFYDAGSWVETTEEDEDTPTFLTASGWIDIADTARNFGVTYETDGTALLALDTTDFRLKFSAAELDVSGEPITNYLTFDAHEPIAATISGNPLFSSGAKIYQVNFIAMNDAYVLDNWYDCEAQHADPNGNCNIVFGYSSANSTLAPTQSFAQLIYPSVASASQGPWFGVGEGIDVRIVQDGVVHITDQLAPEGQQVVLGSWEYRTVHGQQIMALTLPERFTPRLWDGGQQILAVHGGYVRRGTFLPAGTPETFGEIQFNETAFNDIQEQSSVL